MSRIDQREAARRDLIAHFVYLAENAGLDVADRFLAQAELTFADLTRQPMIGAPLGLKHPDLAQVRKWSVSDFDNYLVFYVPHAEGVSIVRVLHAASDWRTLLDLQD
jgi:toxin ParE1/3/4